MISTHKVAQRKTKMKFTKGNTPKISQHLPLSNGIMTDLSSFSLSFPKLSIYYF